MRRSVPTLVTGLLAALTMLGPAAPGSAVAAPGAVRTVTYPGSGAVVTLDHLGRISRTPQSFQHFVDRRLTRLWKDNDPRPQCRSAATMIIKTWRSDGYALISDMGTFAPCPSGGWVQIAVRTDAGWRTPARLAAQEPYRCRALASYDVPTAVVPDGTCYAGGVLVSYDDWRAQH